MSQGNDLAPPQDAVVELEGIGFDFGPALATGETITSVTSLTCMVWRGFDQSPSSRLSGPAFIVSSTKTGAPSAQVNQNFGGALGGTTYRLQCVVVTNAGESLSLWTHFGGVTPT